MSGPFRDPVVRVNDLAAAEANAGTVAEAVIGDATPLGIVGGLLGADKLFGTSHGRHLPRRPGSRPRPAGAGSQVSRPAITNPEAFLKNLFR